MSELSGDVNQAGHRHWLYGVNVALLVVIGAVIIGFVMFLTASYKTKWDLTRNKMYSLSSYTQQLLKQVDEKGQKFQLVSLYPSSTEQGQQVDDLLEEYARASKNVTVEEVRTRDDLENKIRDRYKSEIEPYSRAVADFNKVAEDLDKFSKTEGANLAGLVQGAGVTPEVKRDALQLQGMFASSLPEVISKMKRDVNRQTESTSPDWSRVTAQLKSILDDLEKQLALLSNPAQTKEVVSGVLAKYLDDANPRYKAMDEEVKKYVDELTALKPLKVEEIVQSAGPNTLVVLSPAAATVIDDSKVFKMSQTQQPNQQPSLSFEGEQAISSAILSVVQPEKVKVVFITTGSHPASSSQEDGWSDMADRLREANFDVSEWSPPQAAPGQPPESTAPPAMGKGVVWIVFPPDAPNQQQMMMGMPPPSPQAIIEQLKQHMDQGGQALFLAESGGGASPFSTGSDEYPFADALKPFGIWVQSKYTVVHNYPGPDGNLRVFPRIAVSRYPDTEITRPLQSLQSLMVGFPSQMGGLIGGPTVVSVSGSPPADVEDTVIVESPKDADTWATTTYSQTATFDSSKDMKAPVPMAVAAVKNKGKPNEQRVVVIGSRLIGCNYLINDISAQVDENGRLTAFAANPGNAELVNNSMLWLAGYKNMIAVSSKSAAALRIKDISPATLGILRAAIWAGLPILALVLGGIVWLFRSR